jgi:hypothetical protein
MHGQKNIKLPRISLDMNNTQMPVPVYQNILSHIHSHEYLHRTLLAAVTEYGLNQEMYKYVCIS